jgi:splicing factor 3A subunit 1
MCPLENDNEHLNGQVLDVEVATLSSTIGELKARLAEVLNLPPNKQQLSREHFKTMRDNDTLAYYNVLPDVELSLSVRRRGGR